MVALAHMRLSALGAPWRLDCPHCRLLSRWGSCGHALSSSRRSKSPRLSSRWRQFAACSVHSFVLSPTRDSLLHLQAPSSSVSFDFTLPLNGPRCTPNHLRLHVKIFSLNIIASPVKEMSKVIITKTSNCILHCGYSSCLECVKDDIMKYVLPIILA